MSITKQLAAAGLTKNTNDTRTLSQLLAAGTLTELDYMAPEEAERAAQREADLLEAGRASA
jgi:hypothetical protein